MNKLKEAALDYAAIGYAVFPCKANKQPYTDNGVLDATTNKEKIEKWWDEWPRANIAMDVGGAGLMVLDFDPGHDMGALHDSIGDLPNTKLVQNTPRGGKHLFFQLGKGEVVPASASKLAPHIDVRSFHSYVLLAPSKTKDGEYTWDKNPLDFNIKPAYRSNEMVERASEVKDRDDNFDTWLIEADLPENIASCAKWLENDAKPATKGQGGDQMTYATAAMCKSFGISPEMAFDLLWDYWCPRCVPAWDESGVENLENKIKNAYSYNTSAPGNITDAYKVAKAQELFAPVSRDTRGGGKETKAGRFRAVDRQGIEEIKPPTWLIEGALPEGGYGMLIGPRGTFKTFIALDMALSIATGASAMYEDAKDWLGVWPHVASGPVLFAAGEGRGNIKARIKAWEDYHNEGEAIENFVLIDPVPSPNAEDVTPFIEAALDHHEYYNLVVIDTVGRAMQGLNENSQQDASQLTRMVETIQHELDCAVLAIHHTGHDNNGRARGSSVFGADVDAEFILERDGKEHTVKLKNTKQKDAPEWEEPKLIHLHIQDSSLVAISPTEEQQTKAKQSKSTGRKTNKEQELSIALISKVGYQMLKQYPAKEFSGRAFAEAIAADERVPVGVEAVRKTYIGKLLIDKAHPLHKCFDVGKSVWVYRK